MRRFLSKRGLVWMFLGSLILGILYIYVSSGANLGAKIRQTLEPSRLEKNRPPPRPSRPHRHHRPHPGDRHEEVVPAVAPEAASHQEPPIGQFLPDAASSNSPDVCLAEEAVKTDMDTSEILPALNFEAPWIPLREYWSENMEKRYLKNRREEWEKKPLEVIIMPHSHNDPGWLKTLEGYYTGDTKHILDNAIDKLTKYKNLTFVWTEMQFLAMWWSEAHQIRQRNLKALIAEGRFEILTGGWVMTDEANVDLYAMVDQLVEGHAWIKNTFGVTPKSSWSVDPFGHGGTFPYLLGASGIDGMVIMRIHYAWKEFFAKHQSGDFLWTQRWNADQNILCHNFPYDIYSIKGSCGPKADICVQYNFAAKASGQTYNEYAMATQPITASNIQERAETLLEQYGRTGSLHNHNVVLVPLGDDFLYTKPEEWEAQYTNYKALIDYINKRGGTYHAHLRFGTLSDYFRLARERMESFPTLNGDFFVYSDIFSSGYPAYWSGYFTTRPYMKQLSKELEANLRSAEILFSLSYPKYQSKEMAELYRSRLSVARQNLALFQHHDAITGTSKQHVMYDYGKKMFDALTRAQLVQRTSVEQLLSIPRKSLKLDFERQSYQDLPRQLPFDVTLGEGYLVAFNPLANDVVDMLSFTLEDGRLAHDLCIVDPKDQLMTYQVNPTVGNLAGNKMKSLSMSTVKVVFMAKLPALSIQKFHIFVCSDEKVKPEKKFKKTQVYCKQCPPAQNQKQFRNIFSIDELPNQVAQLESYHFLLTFDPDTKLLTSIKDKINGIQHEVEIELSKYATLQHSSGAYLFALDKYRSDSEFINVQTDLQEVVIVSGSVYTEISVFYRNGEVEPLASIVHTVRLYHHRQSSLSKGIYLENFVDLGDPSNHRDTDVLMRIKDFNIKNGGGEFFTDQNGFQMQRRKILPDLDIGANLYPVTSMAYIQDEATRLSLAVDHAAAASSWQEGWLEVIMDRRAAYDDARGMGEGVLDNEDMVHKYWLLLEKRGHQKSPKSAPLSLPTKVATFLSRRLSFPTHQYVGKFGRKEDRKSNRHVGLMTNPLPCDVHLLNLRTTASDGDFFQPGNSSLMLLHTQASESNYCDDDNTVRSSDEPTSIECDVASFATLSDTKSIFQGLSIVKSQKTTLTGNANIVDSGSSRNNNQPITKPEPMTIETYRIELQPQQP